MRLFIAVQFNDEILNTLSGLQDDLCEQGMKGHYSSRENLHLTLAFIGDYGKRMIREGINDNNEERRYGIRTGEA